MLHYCARIGTSSVSVTTGFLSQPSALLGSPFLTHSNSKFGTPSKQARCWKVNGSRATPGLLADVGLDHVEQFGAVKPPVPSLVDSAWEDDGTLQRKMYNKRGVIVDGLVSLQVTAFVKGPQPQEQLVLATRTLAFALKQGADLGIARGIQWWYPHTHIARWSTSPKPRSRSSGV